MYNFCLNFYLVWNIWTNLAIKKNQKQNQNTYTQKKPLGNRLIQASMTINSKYEIIFKILFFLYTLDIFFISAIHTCTMSLQNLITQKRMFVERQ